MPFISVTNPTFTNGTIADGGQVSTNFSDITTGLRDGTKDISINTGTFAGDVTLGASAADTITFNGKVSGNIDGSGILNAYGARTPGWVNNLGLTLAAGVITVTGADSTAISATNVGYVAVPSTTAGRLACLKVTAPASFNDDSHASSDLSNLGFGITEAAAWANDVPFFLYVVNKGNADLDGVDGSSMFFLSRSPCMTTTPTSANDIGDTGAIPVNDSQDVILILADVTVANYVSLPCQLIGTLRMQWSTVTDDWTVQTFGNKDGFGSTQLDKTFSTTWTMPLGQNGANASSHFVTTGTAPSWATATESYYLIRPTGEVRIFGSTRSGGNVTNGAGGQGLSLSIPYKASEEIAAGRYTAAGWRRLATTESVMLVLIADTNNDLNIYTDSGTQIVNTSFSNAADDVAWDFGYKAF